MKNCEVHSIIELPLFVVETPDSLHFTLVEYPNFSVDTFLPDENSGVDETDDSGSDDEFFIQNAKRNKLVGDLGEEIAKTYLLTQHSKIRQVSKEKGKSGEGYDILADNQLCFEVKTSLSANYEFEISVNELRVSNEKKSDYHIFYIMINVSNKTAKGFIFANPMEKFDTDFDDLVRQVSIFQPTNFKGNLRKHANSVETVELTGFLLEILSKEPKYTENLFA